MEKVQEINAGVEDALKGGIRVGSRPLAFIYF
jgi:hypothetical protein